MILNSSLEHIPVLQKEAVENLINKTEVNNSDSRLFIDATFGRGGHSKLILENLNKNDKLFAFDKDLEAVNFANKNIKDSRFKIYHESFININKFSENSVDGILMDLGVSSPQLDSPNRGFSFRFDSPLDMRMNQNQDLTVADFINQAKLEEITKIIRDFGEERFAFKIAQNIVKNREMKKIKTTKELADLISKTVKTFEKGKHPATRTFQALRIFINQELEELKLALDSTLNILKKNGRLVIISFHSLEDRIVKQFINKNSKEIYDKKNPFLIFFNSEEKILKSFKKIKPSLEEIKNNPRSRSSIMRVTEKR